jgi:malate dehydrogenase (quinone)
MNTLNEITEIHPDAVLVGAGIVSATLESAAQESSNAWNNVGGRHAALCELNYTPERSDGIIDISHTAAAS